MHGDKHLLSGCDMRKKIRKARSTNFSKTKYDAIVVGSGIGGLTTAALLAKRGLSVLILEMHYEVGGCATVFDRRGKGQGYQFDVGFHYLGDCGENGCVPTVLDALGIEPLDFIEQDPDGFDRFCFPDFEFLVPREIEDFRERLKEYFPSEGRGIDRYISLLQQVWRLMQFNKAPMKSLHLLPSCLLALRNKDATLGQFLDTCTKNPQLRAVIAGQHGLYLQPPSRASLVLHAGVATEFFQGAYYLSHGGQILSDRLADVIEANGGTVLLRAKVNRILVENGRVRGVEFQSRNVGSQLVEAPIIISNADPKQTFLELVEQQNVPEKVRSRALNYEMSPALGVAYLGVKRDFRQEGWKNSNLHIFPGYDFESNYIDCREERFSKNPHVFVSNLALKDPDNLEVAPPGVANLQIMAMAPSSFRAWGVTEAAFLDGTYRKEIGYIEAKERFADSMIKEVDRVIKGIGDQIVYKEISTPITARRYLGTSNGTSYGLALVPEQFLSNRPGAKTHVRGLYLCGASTRNGHGIYGALMSGIEAYGAIFGRAARAKILDKSRKYAIASIR